MVRKENIIAKPQLMEFILNVHAIGLIMKVHIIFGLEIKSKEIENQ